LQDISFAESSLDNVKIKDSTLGNKKFGGATVSKETYINVVLTPNHIPIKNYGSFLEKIS